jgi:hypothetical protein
MDIGIFKTYAVEFAALAGVFVPLLVGFLANTNTSSKAKGYMATGISFAVGFIIALGSGQLHALSSDPATAIAELIKFVGIVGVAAQTAFNMWIKPSGLSTTLQTSWGNVAPLEVGVEVETEPVVATPVVEDEDILPEEELDLSGDYEIEVTD